MGLSETILAAIIGALATMATAIVQILRNRAPAEARPKKNRVRSTFAIIALVFGAMVGGYFWSELRAVGAREEIAALRADLKLAAKAEIDARDHGRTALRPQPILARHTRRSRRAVARVAAPNPWRTCRPAACTQQAEDAGPIACTESLATTVALCATVPSVDPDHRRARACARAEERHALARTRLGRSDARQPAHRRGARRNTRRAPTGARCVWTFRTGASRRRSPCASWSTTPTESAPAVRAHCRGADRSHAVTRPSSECTGR